MPLTLDQIIQVSAPAIFHMLGVPYVINGPFVQETSMNTLWQIHNRHTGNYTQFACSASFERETERSRIEIAKSLIENAVRTLQDYENRNAGQGMHMTQQLNFNFTPEQRAYLGGVWNLTNKEPEQQVIDVDFSEEE